MSRYGFHCDGKGARKPGRGTRDAAVALALMMLPASALAQVVQSQQEQLYQQMVRQATNYDVTLAYVRVASDNGDYEAAIGALERLLYYNPSLGRVKYELGTLYFRLGSYEMATNYFNEALASPDIDAGTRASIQSYLAEAQKRQNPSRFSGLAQTGLRYQTNANFAPAGDVTRFGGQDISLPTSARRRPDTNAFALLGLSHDWDLENQRGDVIETRFAGYGTQQFRFHDLDVNLFELSIGPRMAIAPAYLPGATIKPYAIGGMTWVGGAKYVNGAGAGVDTQFPVGPNFTFGPTFEYRHVDFNLSETTPTSVFNTGDWYTTGLAMTATARQGVRFEGRGYYRRGDAGLGFQSFEQWAAEAAVTFDVGTPFPAVVQNISVSPYVRYLWTEFDIPDPFIDPANTRKDTQWIFGGKFDTVLTNTFGFTTTVQYDRTASSLPNYRQRNLSVMAGPTARF